MSNKIDQLNIKSYGSGLKARVKVGHDEKFSGNSEFANIINSETTGKEELESDLKISSHAVKRMNERNIEFDSDEFLRLKSALGKLKDKGGKDSLVITEKAAYILDIDQKTVVTAMERNNLMDNVFTKIDSTLIIDN